MKKTYNEIVKFYNDYEDSFKKCNLFPSNLCALQEHGDISISITTKDKNYKVVSKKEEKITFAEFMNYISATKFFHDRVSKSFTFFGNVVTEMKHSSPDKEERITVEFKYSYKR